MDVSKIKIPSCEADITPAWVNEITGHSVSPQNFNIEANVQEGDGFLSLIYRVAYVTEEGKSHQIIIKLLPSNPKWLEFMLADASDEREIKVYSVALPDFIKVVPELEENICKLYLGAVQPGDVSTGKSRSSIIVMEDLKPAGFRMMNFAGESSDERVHSLMTFMARLHFGSLAVEVEKGVPLSELYPFMQGITNSSEWQEQIDTLCDDGYRLLEKLLADHSISPRVWEEYKKLRPYVKDINRKVEEAGRQYPCFIHGDVWPPNIQVHDSRPVKLLDWQLVGYRDPTYDLSVMLYTVLPEEKLTMDNLRRLLKRYHSEFETLCKERGYQERIKQRSWVEFETFFFTWGISFLLLLCMPSIECYSKNLPKYANVFRFLCEENRLPEFLLQQCQK